MMVKYSIFGYYVPEIIYFDFFEHTELNLMNYNLKSYKPNSL